MKRSVEEVMEEVRAACFDIGLPVSAAAKVKLWTRIQERLSAPKVRRYRERAEACAAGHPYTPENTRIRRGANGRCCRTCKRLSDAKYRAQWKRLAGEEVQT